MTKKATHWTERSPEDFVYSIASDFIEKLQEKMDALPMTKTELAKAAKVSKGYISRKFKDPGNLELRTIVKLARVVGLKVSILGYEDINDPDNSRGPIGADVFHKAWENAGHPSDMWAFVVKPSATPVLNLTEFEGWGSLFKLNRGVGNRAVDVRRSAVTTGVNAGVSEYKIQETKQTSDPEVFV